MEAVTNKRIDYFDIAKGLAMFCVIAGHMGVIQVNAFVFSFHMPLFFLISGYFFRNDSTKVWRNTKRLLIAYGWTVIAIIILSEGMALAKVLLKGEDAITLVKVPAKWIVAGLYGSGARADFLGLNLPRIGAIWFLLALAWGGASCLLSTKYKENGSNLLLAYWFSWQGGFQQSGHGSLSPSRLACVQHCSCS